MALQHIPLTEEDFRKSRWEEAIINCERNECSDYSLAFANRVQQATTDGDPQLQEIFTLLALITYFRLNLDSPPDPFGPRGIVMSGFPIPSLDTIGDAHWAVLKTLAPDISDAEMRARVADVLWTKARPRDYRMAELAITSYLEAAEILENIDFGVPQEVRLERAMQLAASLRNPKYMTELTQRIEALLDKHDGEGATPTFVDVSFMELLQAHKHDDPLKHAAMVERAAVHAESNHNWDLARSLWRIVARWHAIAGDADKQRVAFRRGSETHVQEAEDALARTPPSYTAASHHLATAIEAYRRIEGYKQIEGIQERIDELHKTLLKYQMKTVGEMAAFADEIDVTELVRRATETVQGKTLEEALVSLVLLGSSPKVSALRSQLEENAQRFPLQHRIGQVMQNEDGKIVGRSPGMVSDDPSDMSAAIKTRLHQNANLYQQLHAQSVVEPARQQINLEHSARISDFIPFVQNNPFIPPGRDLIYARGLHAGLTGDFLTAAHLLIPQIEHSIRFVLNSREVITSGLDARLIQDEVDLNELLYLPVVKEILGEDITFDLQGLLVERFGSNLRNRLAHGLISHNGFYTWEVTYLWWLTLRLCYLILIATPGPENSGQIEAAEMQEVVEDRLEEMNDEGTAL